MSKIYYFINLSFIPIYLYLGKFTCITDGGPPGPGDGLVFCITQGPILVVFFFANLYGILKCLYILFKYCRVLPLTLVLLTIISWALAIGFDPEVCKYLV